MRITRIGIFRTSILSGAFFFLTACLTAQDTLPPSDSVSYQLPDSSILTKKGRVVIIDSGVDSLTQDTVKTRGKNKPEWEPDPQRATVLSAVLPGLGQAYNRKYWKIPILYAAGGILYYYYDLNNDAYLENRKLYEQEVANGGNPDAPPASEYRNNYQQYQKKRDYKTILISILYVANIVDAMADAYFISYDIGDDLSFRIRPSILPEPYLTTNTVSCGFTLSLQF